MKIPSWFYFEDVFRPVLVTFDYDPTFIMRPLLRVHYIVIWIWDFNFCRFDKCPCNEYFFTASPCFTVFVCVCLYFVCFICLLFCFLLWNSAVSLERVFVVLDSHLEHTGLGSWPIFSVFWIINEIPWLSYCVFVVLALWSGKCRKCFCLPK